MGRKSCVIPDNFESYCVAVAEGRMTVDEACKELYICRATWYNWKTRKGLSVRAHWYDAYGGKCANSLYKCSRCDGRALYDFERDNLGNWREVQVLTAYCPHCGFKMGSRRWCDRGK